MSETLRALPVLMGPLLSLALGSPSFAQGIGCPYELSPKNPPNDGILFVDNSPAGRSAHFGHALVKYEDGNVLAFYPNCSDDNKGHSAVGWMEYKRSEDGGETWGDPNVLAYSKNLLDAGQAGARTLGSFPPSLRKRF